MKRKRLIALPVFLVLLLLLAGVLLLRYQSPAAVSSAAGVWSPAPQAQRDGSTNSSSSRKANSRLNRRNAFIPYGFFVI